MRFLIGWAFIFLVVFNIAVNWWALLYNVYHSIKAIVRKLIDQYKARKTLKLKPPENDMRILDTTDISM